MRNAVFALSVIALIVSPVASASANSYVPLPELGGKGKALKLKLIRYKGGTNGRMIVDIKNSSKKKERFKATGLYFVPDTKADSAPQRLGAAGPFEVEQQGKWVVKKSHWVFPGTKVRMRLHVFCIDSHRASPSSGMKFSVAKKRMPKKLRQEIDSAADKIVHDNKGDLGRAKGAVQSTVWKKRNKKWIRLQGEGRQESGK